MSGLLRNLACFCFVSLMIGSLWLLAQMSVPPTIPAWRAEDQQLTRPAREPYRAVANLDHDDDYDLDDAATTAAFADDEG